jgi:ribonucleoside-diphosphate reductase alpha chain
MDNPSILDPAILQQLKEHAIAVNAEWASRLGIPVAASITCIKPSGTVSQLVNSSSGLHARHSDYYIRSIRADNKDPVTAFLIASGVYHEPDVMKPDKTTVFFFAQKAPEGAITRDKQTAIDALETWKLLQDHWCEHKPSATVNVREDDWMDVGAWVYRNFDKLSGVSFLPYDGGSYRQAPYQEVTKEEYEQFVKDHPYEIDWNNLPLFEKEDNTTGTQELSCVAGACEVSFIGKAEYDG